MVHPDGPAPFPTDPAEDRDSSRDPRSVSTIALDAAEAKKKLERDNPGFDILTGPTEVVFEEG